MNPVSSAATGRTRATHERFLADGVVLAVRLADGERTLEATRAAARGGVRILEITLTTPGALAAIAELSREADLCVGAGTVLTADDVAAVAEAGGAFALSPVFDAEVLDAAARHDVFAVPGAATPGEILAAHRYGAALVKIFPAGPLGGPEFLRFVRGPLPEVPLMPTSGPDSTNLAEYLRAGAVAVGVGREILHDGWTAASLEEAARRTRRAFDEARRSLAG